MTTALLDFDALTAPIDGEQPAGFRLPSDVRKKMEDARKEFEPNPEDPSAAPVPKKPDWSIIVRLATDNLTAKSKDLLAAARLVEALTRRDGFAGLRDGLKLLRLLTTDAWDRIHPLIEEPSDIDSRAGPFEWLNEAEGGAWFPSTVRKIPLLRVDGQVVCLQDCQEGKVGEQTLSPESLRGADPASDTTVEEVAECLTELGALDQALGEKMADQAPSLLNVRDALAGALGYLQRLTSSSAGEESQEPAAGEGGGTSSGGSPAKSSGVTNRAETYRQLAMLADQLAKLEPHSPIPDLLRWAVKLGDMPFRQLIQEFVREPGVLTDIRRQFGIPEPESSNE